ncbi:MAG: hypothetical protein IBX71_09265 [Candidatus Desulforudis sp.]|nr:hypothetical protein [Desulforudis sp.]
MAVLAELHRLLGNRSDDQKSWDWIRKSLDALLDMRFGGEIDEMVLIEDTLHLKIWNLVGVMRRGQVVTIYVDPYSRTVEEGRAELLSLGRVETNAGPGEYWTVRFLDDERVEIRFIPVLARLLE